MSAFLERESPPADEQVHEALGRSAALWDLLSGRLEARFGPLERKWGWSGKAYGWSLRLIRKKTTVLYFIPYRGHFVASFALREKACRAARESGLPAPILAAIDAAPRYPEGRAVRVEVRRKSDAAAVEKLSAIKLAN